MKKNLTLLLAALFVLVKGTEPNFSVSFDKTLNGKTLSGKVVEPCTSGNTVLSKDIHGYGVAHPDLGGFAYPVSQEWFNINNCTVNFFIRPNKWGNGVRPESKKNHFIPILLIDAGKSSVWSMLFFVNWTARGSCTVQLQSRIYKDNKLKSVYAATTAPKETFIPDEWTMVTLAWNEQDIAVFLNGKKVTSNHYGFPTTKKHNPKWQLRFFPSDFWKAGKLPEMGIADLRVYDSFLSYAQIADLYTEYKKKSKPEKQSVLAVPKTSVPVNIDGKIEDSEWKDASCIPIGKGFGTGFYYGTQAGKMYVKHDEKNLLIAATAPGKARLKAPAKENTNKVFSGSEFEIWWRLPGENSKETCQFGIAPNGAWAFRKGKSWRKIQFSSGTAQTSDSWNIELSIPFKEMGISPRQTAEMEFCLHQMDIADRSDCWLVWDAHNISGNLRRLEENLGLVSFRDDTRNICLQRLGEPEYGNLSLNFSARDADLRFTAGENVLQDRNKLAHQQKLVQGLCSVEAEASADGALLFRYSAGIKVKTPFSVDAKCFASKKKIVFQVDLRGLSAIDYQASIPPSLTLSLVDMQGKALLKKQYRISGPTAEYELPFDSIQPGKYQLKLEAAINSRMFVKTIPFERPDDVFITHPAGMERTVPFPFHPIAASGNTVTASYARYEFGSTSFLPEQVFAHGNKLFAAAPSLEVKTGNGTEVFSSGKTRLVESAKDKIVHEGVLKGRDVEISWTRQIMYDGMIRIDFRVSPRKKQVMIQDLKVHFSLEKESSQYALSPSYSAKWTKEGILDVFPCAWLSGQKAGFSIFTHNDKNWLYKGEPLRMRRQKDGTALMSAVMIEQNAVLTKPADYTLAMIATPTKPPREDFRRIHLSSLGHISGQTCQVVGWDGLGHRCFKRSMDFSQPVDAGIRYWEKYLLDSKAKVTQLLPYIFGGMPSNTPVADYYGYDWENKANGETRPPFGVRQDPVDQQEYYFCRFFPSLNSAYKDYLSYYLNELLKKYDCFVGMYIDGFSFFQTDMPYQGESLVSVFPQKKEIRNYDIFGARETYERCYKVIRANRGEKGLLIAHDWDVYFPMMNSFADVGYPGEEYMHSIREGERVYMDATPLEKWQSNYNSAIYGLAMQFLGQWAKLGGDLRRAKPEIREKLTRPAITMCLLHDVQVAGDWFPPVDPIWNLFSNTELNKASFIGYWQKGAISSPADNVKISHYNLQNGDICVIVGNLAKEGNAPVLKLPEGHDYTDALDHQKIVPGQPVEVSAGGYRIIWGKGHGNRKK